MSENLKYNTINLKEDPEIILGLAIEVAKKI